MKLLHISFAKVNNSFLSLLIFLIFKIAEIRYKMVGACEGDGNPGLYLFHL